ncbi:hypothetical protein EJ08DRAFT_68782 [Tothia fuscella]|uniref:Signal peptide peptidase n=1 Tax=Tothia fuscella TaxID=1048955 RepID=A0A9P4NER6_9PEZI|nr:hypothetical protein EJ08DRAFT_68782 [Tothia fuscella]
MSEPGPVAEFIGRIAYTFTKYQPFLTTEIHIILAALFPIVAAAHASLSRPSSAAAKSQSPTKSRDDASTSDDDEEEEEDSFQRMEAFSRSDALWMPLLAGLVLTGLYFLIKYLKDLEMLNKVLNWYFSTVGLFSVCKLLADTMQFAHSFVFPKWYKDEEGVWHVDSKKGKTIRVVEGEGDAKSRSSPLPGVLAKLPLPAHVNRFLWAVRSIPSKKLSFKFYLHSVAAFRTHLGLYGILGTLLGTAATGYYNFVDKPWWLTNLMGWSFSYTSLQLMSPTTFDTGSLILVGLFFYDIFMVFYTPMMVTVAKSLDVPIKLIIPRAENPNKPGIPQYSMLGLGDIVLPGMMIGLALRYDLYRHYLQQQKHSSPAEETATKDASPEVTTTKAKYIPPGNYWSSKLWTSSLFGLPSSLPAPVQTGSFRKTYFWTSIIGYIVGMITTLVVMQWFQHAQPALLYLVPGVLIPLWGSAWIRGDLKEMWTFTEAEEESLQTTDSDGEKKDRKESRSNKSMFSEEKSKANEAKILKSLSKMVQHGESEDDGEEVEGTVDPKAKGPKLENQFKRDKRNDLIYFAIGWHAPLKNKEEKKKKTEAKHAVSRSVSEAEPPTKRLRTA